MKYSSERVDQIQDSLVAEIKRSFLRAVDDCLLRVQEEAMRRAPIATGNLARSITTQFAQYRDGRIVGKVGVMSEYGVYVEYGTGGHYPPRRPIILWVAQKLGLRGVDLRRAVRAVQWKIYQKGTRAQPFLKPAIDKNRGYMMMRMQQALKEIVQGL